MVSTAVVEDVVVEDVVGSGVSDDDARFEELLGWARVLAGRINADQAALAAAMAELSVVLDDNLGWGFRSARQRLAYELRLTSVDAGRLLTAGARMAELPVLAATFAAGELSLPVVARMSEIATPDNEADLVELARHTTAGQMLRTCRAWERVRDATDDQGTPTPPDPFFSLQGSGDGDWELSGRLGAADGAMLEQALRQRRSELVKEGAESVSDLDAFLSLIDRGGSPVAERFLAVLHVDLDTMADHQPGDGTPTGVRVADGPPLSDDDLDRFHGRLSTVWIVSRSGHPLWISSPARSAPPWMRRAMQFEQPRCQVHWCERAGFLHAHHSIPYHDNPETLFDGQVFLCPWHHRALHESGATIEFDDQRRIVIRNTDGTIVAPTGSITLPDDAPHERTDDTAPVPPQITYNPLTTYAVNTVIDNLGWIREHVQPD